MFCLLFLLLENQKFKNAASQINHQMALWDLSMESAVPWEETRLKKQARGQSVQLKNVTRMVVHVFYNHKHKFK